MDRWSLASQTVLAALVLCAVGCASEPKEPPRAPTSAALDAWVVASAPRAAPRSVKLSPLAAGPIRIPPPPSAPPRPRRAHAVDISFQRADLVNALQFLAEAGRFNLVLESGLQGQVSATLRGVEPFDALVALAEANGGTVRYAENIVTVHRR